MLGGTFGPIATLKNGQGQPYIFINSAHIEFGAISLQKPPTVKHPLAPNHLSVE